LLRIPMILLSIGSPRILGYLVIQPLFDVLWVHVLYVSVVLYVNPEPSDFRTYFRPVAAVCERRMPLRRRCAAPFGTVID
jgi:hypothetical protein